MKQPSVTEIARKAKVSTATVSRVLRGSGPVSRATRQRVLDAAVALGAGMPAPVVVIVVRDIENPYFAHLASQLQAELVREEQLPLVLSTTTQDPDSDLDEDAPDLLLALKAAGIVNLGVDHQSKSRVSEIAKVGLPMVMFAEPQTDNGQNCDYVFVDSKPGMKDAMRHLRDSGHRRLAFLGARGGFSFGRERLNAFRETATNLGFSESELLEKVGDGKYDPDDGRQLVADLQLMPADERPTVVFAGNDVLALGMLQECGARGIAVPGDLSVIGYDNTPMCELVHPTLASLAPPVEEIARTAADLLLARINATSEGRTLPVEGRIVDAHFWVRDRASIGAAPTRR
jgi:LacI family transcriptional regulator, galactose operon repressor